MSTTKNTNTLKVAAAVLALVATLTLTGCGDKGAAPTTPSASASTAPVVTPAPAVTPEPVTKDSPAETVVPRDQVEAIRADGGHVFVPLSGNHDGIIVDITPGAPLPAALIADAKVQAAKVQPGSGNPGMAAFMDLYDAVELSGLAVFVLYRTGTEVDQPDDTVNYTVNAMNVPGVGDFWASINGGRLGWTTTDEARAEVAPLVAANPNVLFLDLTV